MRRSAPEPSALGRLADRALLGAFVHEPGGVEGDPRAVAALEGALGRRLDVVHDYLPWGRPLAAVTDKAPGRRLLVSWQPTARAVRELAAGRPDGYCREVVAGIAALDEAVAVRFGHEMNGAWNPWCSAAPGGPSAEEFRTAWRVLAGVLRDAGARAQLVWCPDEHDSPDRAGNRWEDYWPGADVVDVVGVDAYDWGEEEPVHGDGRRRSSVEVVRDAYARVERLPGAGHLPVWLCETGTTEVPGDPLAKGRWYEELYGCTDFPRLAAVVHFSEDDRRDVQRDWRLTSSPATTAALRRALAGTGVAAPAGPGRPRPRWSSRAGEDC